MNSNRNNEMQMLEDNQISIRWPESIRTGEKDSIQINVSLAQDFRPLIDQSTTSRLQEIELPVNQFNINLEARVDLAGMRIEPEGLLSKNIRPGQKIKFNWDISSNRAGEYDGTLWLYMNLVPKDQTSEKMKEVLLAKPIKITITNILGFPVIFIRVFAFTLLLVSTILILIGSGTNNK